jgi:putative hemolysin
MDKKYTVALVILLATGMLAIPSMAMINPSGGYCTALGYQYGDTVGKDGSMTGYCVLPGNRSVDAWQFLQGKVSPELSYCQKQDLEIRTISDPGVCGFLGSTCAVCVKADGTTQEVTKMMGLDFRERICDENICCDPTDEHCAIGEDPTDWFMITITVIAVLIIAGIGYLLFRRQKGTSAVKKNP